MLVPLRNSKSRLVGCANVQLGLVRRPYSSSADAPTRHAGATYSPAQYTGAAYSSSRYTGAAYSGSGNRTADAPANTPADAPANTPAHSRASARLRWRARRTADVRCLRCVRRRR